MPAAVALVDVALLRIARGSAGEEIGETQAADLWGATLAAEVMRERYGGRGPTQLDPAEEDTPIEPALEQREGAETSPYPAGGVIAAMPLAALGGDAAAPGPASLQVGRAPLVAGAE